MRLVATPTGTPSRGSLDAPAPASAARSLWARLAGPLDRVGVPVLLLGLVLLLYGEALHYAFMYDDGLDLARGEDRSVLSLLTSGEGAFYYRPLPFIAWKGMHALLGRYDLFWFHLPPLLLHALNAYLLYRLARALRLGPVGAFLAALLFVVFPFHYQVVPWAGAVFHPLVTALVLGALLAYRCARVGGSRGWLAASFVCAVLALFTHEYAITLGMLIAGLELWLWRDGQVSAWRPYALAYFALAGVYLLWWAAVPKWPRAYSLDPESLWRNALMFLQAGLWPITLGWHWAPPALLARPELALAALGSLTLPLLGWLFWRAGALRWLLAAVIWLGVTALPVWATLSWEYLEDGARLYYLPGVGIALGWAALVQLVAPRGWQRHAAQVLLLAVYGWAIWQSVAFVADRRAMYEEGTHLLLEAAAASRAVSGNGEVLYVNFPAWKAPVDPAFPLGNTGVTFVPEYVLLGQALHVNGGRSAAVESLATEGLRGGWPDHYGPHGHWASAETVRGIAAAAAASYVVRYTADGARLEAWQPGRDRLAGLGAIPDSLPR